MCGGQCNSNRHGAVEIIYLASNAGLRSGIEAEKADETEHQCNSSAGRWKPKSQRIHHNGSPGLVMQDV